jgi:hypothetical protein
MRSSLREQSAPCIGFTGSNGDRAEAHLTDLEARDPKCAVVGGPSVLGRNVSSSVTSSGIQLEPFFPSRSRD